MSAKAGGPQGVRNGQEVGCYICRAWWACVGKPRVQL